MKHDSKELKILPIHRMVFDPAIHLENELGEIHEDNSDLDALLDDSFDKGAGKDRFVDFMFDEKFFGPIEKGVGLPSQAQKWSWLKEQLSSSDFHDLIHSYYMRVREDEKISFYPLDDAMGQLKEVVIGYTNDYSMMGENQQRIDVFHSTYEEIIKNILDVTLGKEDVCFYTIVRHENSKKELENIFSRIEKEKGEKINYKIINKNNHATVWIQDEIIPIRMRQEKETKIILLGTKYSLTSRLISNMGQKAFEAKKILPDAWVGGNILFVGEYVLAGYKNLICKNNITGKEYDTDEFKDKVHELFGTEKEKIIIIGNKENYLDIPPSETENYAWLDEGHNYQPIYHLDLFMTFAGLSDDGKKYRLVVGEPIVNIERDDSFFLKKNGILDWTTNYLEKIVEELSENEDFEMIRIPMPLTWVDIVNNVGDLKRIWAFASYNNGLLQYLGQGNKSNSILLPRYGVVYSSEKVGYKNGRNEPYYGGDWSELLEIEQDVENKWRTLGFEPKFISNFLPYLIFRGALRCMTKVVGRTELNESYF